MLHFLLTDFSWRLWSSRTVFLLICNSELAGWKE